MKKGQVKFDKLKGDPANNGNFNTFAYCCHLNDDQFDSNCAKPHIKNTQVKLVDKSGMMTCNNLTDLKMSEINWPAVTKLEPLTMTDVIGLSEIIGPSIIGSFQDN